MFILWIQLLCVVLHTAYGGWYDVKRGSSKCKADEEEPWSYRGKNGPKYWAESFPTCSGQEQSPIAIKSQYVYQKNNLHKLDLVNYDKPVTKATIENTGRTIEVTPSDGVERTIKVNDDIYKLSQLHFHWGETGYRGSEHIVDGEKYSMEMHFVHRNEKDEIAVVAVFFEEQWKENEELNKLIAEFPEVKYKDMSTEFKYKLNLNYLLPENPATFFRYVGSLTTPPCTEGVTWSVLPKVQPVGKRQMKEFRKLYSATEKEATKKCKISDNYRPVQPLNHRTVFLSE